MRGTLNIQALTPASLRVNEELVVTSEFISFLAYKLGSVKSFPSVSYLQQNTPITILQDICPV